MYLFTWKAVFIFFLFLTLTNIAVFHKNIYIHLILAVFKEAHNLP